MTAILTLFDKYLFAGVPSNFVYDLIKTAWEKANQKSWEQLYLVAFQEALKDMLPYLSKYGSGVVEFESAELKKVLTQDLHLTTDELNLYKLSTKKFTADLAKSLRKRQALIIGGHNLSEVDYEQLLFNLIKHAESIFKQSIISNEEAFRKEILTETQNNLSEIEKVQDYLRLHHDVVLVGLEKIENILETQNSHLIEIHSDVLEIKRFLGIDRTRTKILEEIESVLKQTQKGQMFTEGLCSGYILSPHPSQYFLAQEFNPISEDLRAVLSDSLRDFSMLPIRADDVFESGHLICKISGLIQSTPFGIYQLTDSQNRNVYLELGIALGLGKPFVLIKDKSAIVAPILDGIEYLAINHYLELKYNLGDKLKPFIANIVNYTPKSKNYIRGEKSIIISHGNIDTIDFVVSTARIISNLGFRSIILGGPTEELTKYLKLEKVDNFQIIGEGSGIKLDDVIAAIQTSRYGIYRIEKDCSPDAFVSLGIAMGANCPGALIRQENAVLPSDLKGLSSISFKSYTSLFNTLSENLKRIFS